MFVGCRPRAEVFVCAADAECNRGKQAGVCEPTGYCAFPDKSCPEGRRYGVLATAGLADVCVPAPWCGNGRLDPGEACDDANEVNGDGCTAGCMRCEQGESSFAWGREGRCFSRYNETLTWTQAQAFCANRSGNLAVLARPELYQAVTEALAPTTGDTLWVGLLEWGEEANYRWVTHQDLAPLDWHSGYPRGYGPDNACGAISRGASGRMGLVDGPCRVSLGFVCENAPRFRDVMSRKVYWLLPGQSTWDEADTRCRVQGGRLARLTTATMHGIVARRFGGMYWIGARREAGQSSFFWAGKGQNPEPLKFAPLGPGEPNEPEGGAACLLLSNQRLWFDEPCGTRFSALCEALRPGDL